MESEVNISTVSLIALALCASPARAGKEPATLCPSTDAVAKPCLEVRSVEKLLQKAPLRVRQVKGTSGGVTGALALDLEDASGKVRMRAKWKAAPKGGGGINNDPRKELAAYALQRLFLDPDEYVVPPTEARCIARASYSALEEHDATFEGTDCVLGVLAFWIDGLEPLKGVDKDRFERDIKYRATLSNLNLLTYLVNHRDTRPSNFAVSKDKDTPRAFSIDNGLSLSGIANPRTLLLGEWQKIRVPKLPYAKIERLRRITRADLDRLATVAQFTVRDGQLLAKPVSAPLAPDDGVRVVGDVVQLGLTKKEIDGIEQRLRDLLRRVDAHEIEEY